MFGLMVHPGPASIRYKGQSHGQNSRSQDEKNIRFFSAVGARYELTYSMVDIFGCVFMQVVDACTRRMVQFIIWLVGAKISVKNSH